MSEFYEMLKEAMVGDEPFKPDAGTDALNASVGKFERRMRAVRGMALFATLFAGAVMITGIVLFVKSGEAASTWSLISYAAMALFGFSIIGFMKMWFAHMLNHIAIMKELKAVQLRVLELGSR